MRQYFYSKEYDQTILTTHTVENIMELLNELVKHISPTKKKRLGIMKQLKILKRDFNHAKKTRYGKR